MNNQALIDKFITYITAERRYSPLTVRNYLHDLTTFEEWGRSACGKDFSLREVTAVDVGNWVMHLRIGCVNNKINVVSAEQLAVIRAHGTSGIFLKSALTALLVLFYDGYDLDHVIFYGSEKLTVDVASASSLTNNGGS